MQHGVPDDEIERVVLVRNGFGVGDTTVDVETEMLGVAQRNLDHAGRQVGDRTALRHPTLHQVEQEEAGAATQFERALVRELLISGGGDEPPLGIVDAAFVVRDRPLVVVRLGFPVVVEHLGELGVLHGRRDLFGGGVRVRRGVDPVGPACSHGADPTHR